MVFVDKGIILIKKIYTFTKNQVSNMIRVKSFVKCSYCNETYDAEMDTAAEDVFEEGINALMMEYGQLETID